MVFKAYKVYTDSNGSAPDYKQYLAVWDTGHALSDNKLYFPKSYAGANRGRGLPVDRYER